jgi:alpha-D-ribose 1-methylphosphonate 5-triphosphate synthase subunit PhnI
MTAHGNGSEMSPIVISDDESETVASPRQQVKHAIDSQLEREPLEAYAARQVRDTHVARGMKMMLGMGYTPGRGLGFDLDGKTACPILERSATISDLS